MIFELIPASDEPHPQYWPGCTVLKVHGADAADAQDMLSQAFPTLEVYLVCAGGYMNALEVWQ